MGFVLPVPCLLLCKNCSPLGKRCSQRTFTKSDRDVDLIFDALPFGRLRYGEPHGFSNAIDRATF